MFSKKMLGLLNGQLVAESYSGYLYLAMSAWLQNEGHVGAAKWMSFQAREEFYHAMKFFKYIQDRGGQVKLGAIDAPSDKWNAPLEIFEEAYRHEQKISALINNLMTQAKSEGDHASEIFLQWFVTEQIEEESTVLEVVGKYKLAAGQGSALFMIDQELGARTLSVMVQNALTGTAPAA